jgi:hypothetical protein
MWTGTNPDLPKLGLKLQALYSHRLPVLAYSRCFPIRLHPISGKCLGWMVSRLTFLTILRFRVPAIAAPVLSISAHGNTRTHPQAVFLHSRSSKTIGMYSRTPRTPAQAEQTRLILHQAMHPILHSIAYQDQTVSLKMTGSIHSLAWILETSNGDLMYATREVRYLSTGGTYLHFPPETQAGHRFLLRKVL